MTEKAFAFSPFRNRRPKQIPTCIADHLVYPDLFSAFRAPWKASHRLSLTQFVLMRKDIVFGIYRTKITMDSLGLFAVWNDRLREAFIEIKEVAPTARIVIGHWTHILTLPITLVTAHTMQWFLSIRSHQIRIEMDLVVEVKRCRIPKTDGITQSNARRSLSTCFLYRNCELRMAVVNPFNLRVYLGLTILDSQRSMALNTLCIRHVNTYRTALMFGVAMCTLWSIHDRTVTKMWRRVMTTHAGLIGHRAPGHLPGRMAIHTFISEQTVLYRYISRHEHPLVRYSEREDDAETYDEDDGERYPRF